MLIKNGYHRVNVERLGWTTCMYTEMIWISFVEFMEGDHELLVWIVFCKSTTWYIPLWFYFLDIDYWSVVWYTISAERCCLWFISSVGRNFSIFFILVCIHTSIWCGDLSIFFWVCLCPLTNKKLFCICQLILESPSISVKIFSICCLE